MPTEAMSMPSCASAKATTARPIAKNAKKYVQPRMACFRWTLRAPIASGTHAFLCQWHWLEL